MDQEIKDEFKKVHTAVANLSATVEQLAQSTAKGFADVRKEFTEVRKRFGAVDKRFSALEHRVGSLEHQVGMLKEDMRGFRVSVDALPEEIADKVDDTYGEMLNAHEDRIRALETA